MDITITQKDLNGVDQMNGSGSVSSKGYVLSGKGEALKGSLAKYNGSFSSYKEQMFIKGVRKQIYEYEVERFKYEGLPEEVDKYRLETKTIEQGSAAVIKIGENYYVCNYTTKTFNMYNEPRMIVINEPLSPKINGLQFDVELDEAIIFRNNKDMISNYIIAYRFISDMERSLYQLEVNLTKSSPKGIINLKGAEFDESGENPLADSMEKVIQGENTFYLMRSKAIEDQSVGDDNGEQVFIPIEFTDRTETLISNYTFFKEQLKEIVGAMSNQMQEKKERLVSGEVDVQQPLANGTRQHAFNIREINLAKINKTFGLNISIDYQSDEREDEEEEQEVEDE